MTQLQPIEYQGQRVLTTAQLAESYGTTADKISYNFNYNESRYQASKHYFLLTGEDLRNFKEANREFQGSLNKLYLWTEKGAWLHAKSLSTDRAWEAYDMLVDDYYRVKEASINLTGLSPQLQLLIAMEHRQLQIEQRQQQTESQLTTIKETFMQRDDNWRQKITGMLNGAAPRFGGHREVRTESYRILEERAHCKLNTRLANLKERLAEQGATKSKISDANRLDVIEADPRLKEIYTTIVKELSIGTLV
ncbi:ORF6N domain-containing protein [Paenibacillus lautus]|uniref:ORF6N domain-containing protein n=1 Tax=Paenibacillus lautus TaxID=1401 RepID=A0A385U0R5_PAELA|nr:ORF6N domain-containing protein [Paenibacillus lautus]AYB47165.1 ORF6N domain-containing protein [Paenibacillus lautus]